MSGEHGLDFDRDLLGLHVEHDRDRLTGGLFGLIQTLGLAEDTWKVRHLKSPPFADAPRGNAVGAHRHHPFPNSSSSRLQIASAVISLTSLWRGMTTGVEPQVQYSWLPFWRCFSKRSPFPLAASLIFLIRSLRFTTISLVSLE